MKSLLRLAAGTLLAAASAVVAQPRSSPQAPWLADYAALKAAMERDYANLAWFASPEGGVDLPELDRRTEAAIRGASTEAEARAAVRAFVEALDDGHFSVLGATPVEPGAAAAEPPRPDLRESTADQACAALGYANRSQVGFSLPFETLPGFTLLATGEDNSFRLGIVPAGRRKLAVLRIRNFGPTQFPAECARAWNASPPEVRADAGAFAEAVQDQWLRTLADTIGRAAAQRPDALIVDVGNNSGGNDSGDWAPRLFTRRDLRSAPLLMTAGPIAAEYLDQEIAATEAARDAATDAGSRRAAGQALATMRGRRAAAAAAGCRLDWAWRERRAWNPRECARLADVGFASGVIAFQAPGTVADERIARRIYWPARVDALRGRWSGPLYVLTDGRTYSSAELFTALLQDNGAARIAGAPTGGDGCGFMIDRPPLSLPHLGLRIRMSNCVRLRADGSDEVAGVRPDLALLPRDGESTRARAARLLEAVDAELARAR